MIELLESELKTFKGHSSKGNQLKWLRDDIWYKTDYTGYEGLSEYIVSVLLAKSNLRDNDFVLYDTENIKYKHSFFTGAKSADFMKEGDQLITLSRLYNTRYNRDFTKDVWHIHDIKDRLSFLVDQVIRMTNLKDFGIYLCKMLTVDALFLNEDRHLHNVAVLMKPDGSFDYCPLFDHGASLLADTTMDYPLGVDIYELIPEVKAKTVCTSFDDALDAAEALYGQHLNFDFSKADVHKLLSEEAFYSQDIKLRVEQVINEQMRKYKYLFNEGTYQM